MIPSDDVIIKAVFRATEMIKGMGYIGEYGTVHLLDLNLINNAISSIFNNLIIFQLKTLGVTIDENTHVKTFSDNKIKANRISDNEGYYICISYRKGRGYTIAIRDIKVGELVCTDWNKSDRTQFSFLNQKGQSKLRSIMNESLFK